MNDRGKTISTFCGEKPDWMRPTALGGSQPPSTEVPAGEPGDLQVAMEVLGNLPYMTAAGLRRLVEGRATALDVEHLATALHKGKIAVDA